ncbi:thylakoid membrane photosystem I accumulation factor [Kovacikia minuta CCNUW1]|uniref:thylakoid membrane photosystem I accumulation factor n=1 Tax=Kovacikia minuta TaxID=2931930 RepID=UPI001CCE366D|nr:thylakoid membrane photosystem I accumulation factor [Kovacikia minuta]UBF24443.1 thylakoid membrane photosystem I accumulation factor [Kovacikia minuta CCNUW1]
MTFLQPHLSKLAISAANWLAWGRRGWRSLSALLVILTCLLLVNTAPALAGLNDDRYDGDIFPLYAGNGSLIPPRVSLAEALKSHRPSLLVLYIDDSSDCKQYALVISRLQEFYGKPADFIALRTDALPQKAAFDPTEPGYYYKGVVPQTVLFDASGKAVLNEKGVLSYEQIDDKFREVFNLLPRSESVQLKRRQVNEVTTELAQ